MDNLSKRFKSLPARLSAIAATTLVLGLCGAAFYARMPTDHPVEPASLGTPSRSQDLERLIEQPGPIDVETVIGADWQVPRSGLLNLEHPRAREAHLTDGDEPIEIYLHALRHPRFGTFIVDTGVERKLRDDPEHAAFRGVVADVMHFDRIKVRTDTATFIAREAHGLAGVFLTHLHSDHISGLGDVPLTVPIYVGAGEARGFAPENVVIRPLLGRLFEGRGPLREWRFTRDPDGRFAGVTDVFGDGSLWAIHVPGHTAGSTAYLARTPRGPVLLTGDACHTEWGWQHQVEPGTYSSDRPRSADSLATLERLVREHPSIDVRLGHQPHATDARQATRD